MSKRITNSLILNITRFGWSYAPHFYSPGKRLVPGVYEPQQLNGDWVDRHSLPLHERCQERAAREALDFLP